MPYAALSGDDHVTTTSSLQPGDEAMESFAANVTLLGRRAS